MKSFRVPIFWVFAGCFLFAGGICFGETVTLPWSSSLDCAAWTSDGSYDVTPPEGCSEFTLGSSGADNYACGTYSAMLPAANRPGSPGNGIRQLVDSAVGSSGVNLSTTGFVITFGSRSSVWIRWYQRYQRGFTWADLQFHKDVYLVDSGSEQYVIPEPHGNTYRVVCSDGKGKTPVLSSSDPDHSGWSYVGDGNWHLYELHATQDGHVQMWIDQNQIINENCGFAFPYPWDHVEFGSNSFRAASACYAIDYDDLAISNTGYIGPVGGWEPFPTTAVLDDFNREDNQGPLSQAWTDQNYALRVSNHQSVGTAPGADRVNAAYWTASTFGPDSEVYATIATLPAAGEAIDLYLRATAAPGGYDVGLLMGKGIGVYRIDNGAWTKLGETIRVSPQAGDKFGARMVGNTLTVWYNAQGSGWANLATITDSTYTGAGYTGLSINGTNAALDDFGGGMFKPARRFGNSVYGFFLSDGLYKYDGSWTRITQTRPQTMAALGSSLYAYFPSDGLYRYDGTWTFLAKTRPESAVASTTAGYLYFSSDGLYKYDGSWTFLTKNQPASMATSGKELFAYFTSDGLYKYDGAWTMITSARPTSIIASRTGFYAHFASDGLYSYNGTWTRIARDQPQTMIVSGSTLYPYFASDGLYKYDDGTWTFLTRTKPADIAASSDGFYAYFPSDGLYKYNGSWTMITPTRPQTMVVSGSALYAYFASDGLYKYDDGTWTFLTRTQPTDMVGPGEG